MKEWVQPLAERIPMCHQADGSPWQVTEHLGKVWRSEALGFPQSLLQSTEIISRSKRN